jgi:uncharacterized membrane protein (UPF0127 family)
MRIYIGNKLVWSKIKPANTIWTRLIGLIRTPGLDPDEGLMIWPCKQVHGFHMKYALDVIFLDKNKSVLSIVTLSPGHISPSIRNAYYALEVTAGQARLFGIKPGDMLFVEETGKNSKAYQ